MNSVKILARLIIAQYTLQALFDTDVQISPLERSGHIGQRIIIRLMIKLILVDFDVKNANITLKICTHEVYKHVYCLCCGKISFTYLYKQLRYEGGGRLCRLQGYCTMYMLKFFLCALLHDKPEKRPRLKTSFQMTKSNIGFFSFEILSNGSSEE